MMLEFPKYHCDVSKIDYTIEFILDKYNYPEIGEHGTKRWYNSDRIKGPAIIYTNGSKFYYQNNRLHREDGPAVIHADGEQQYYQNGKLHRFNGPAVIYYDGDVEYWENGKRIK